MPEPSGPPVERLRFIAEAATPGPWRWEPAGVEAGDGYRERTIVKDILRSRGQNDSVGPGGRILRTGEDLLLHDANFIATFDPSTVLKLLDAAELLETVSRGEHDNGQILSKGVLHPGPWETCRAMICEDVRAALEALGEP